MQNTAIDQLTNMLIGLITEVKEDKLSIRKASAISNLANSAIKSNLNLIISHQAIQNKKLELRQQEIDIKNRNLSIKEKQLL